VATRWQRARDWGAGDAGVYSSECVREIRRPTATRPSCAPTAGLVLRVARVWLRICRVTRGSSRVQGFARATRSTETKTSRAPFAACCWGTSFFTERGRRSPCSRHE